MSPDGSTLIYGAQYEQDYYADHVRIVAHRLGTGTDQILTEKWDRSTGDRMAIAGGSYGGYLVSWLTTETDRYAASICHAGVTDLLGHWASDRTAGRVQAVGGAPWEDMDAIQRWSSMAHTHQIATPTLVIHGELDYRVVATQGLVLYGTLKAKGVPASWRTTPTRAIGMRTGTMPPSGGKRSLAGWTGGWGRHWLEEPVGSCEAHTMKPEDKNEWSQRKPLEVGTHNRFDLGPVAATTAVAAVAAVAVAAVLALIIPGLVERHLLEAEATSIQNTVDEIARSIESDGTLTEANFAQLQVDVEHTLLGREIVRVKVWDDSGTIVFSDEERLIGATYPMTEDLLAAFSGELISEEPDLAKVENQYERNLGDLREYYVPMDSGTQGVEAVFEVYEVADKLVDTVADIRLAVWTALGVGAAMLLGALVAAGVANARAERRRQARSKRLIGQLIEIREDERTRIVGALHDDIGQPLYRILFGLQASRGMVEDDSDVGQELERLDRLIREVDTTLRSELTTLREEPGVEIDLELALAELVEVSEARTNLEIEFESDVDTELPLPHRSTLYRAAKEALTNVDKHAHASHVTVRLIEGRNTTMLEVVDDGSGSLGPPGLGLTTTKDRLESIGGGIDIVDAKGGGTRFRAWVPVDHPVPR